MDEVKVAYKTDFDRHEEKFHIIQCKKSTVFTLDKEIVAIYLSNVIPQKDVENVLQVNDNAFLQRSAGSFWRIQNNKNVFADLQRIGQDPTPHLAFRLRRLNLENAIYTLQRPDTDFEKNKIQKKSFATHYYVEVQKGGGTLVQNRDTNLNPRVQQWKSESLHVFSVSDKVGAFCALAKTADKKNLKTRLLECFPDYAEHLITSLIEGASKFILSPKIIKTYKPGSIIFIFTKQKNTILIERVTGKTLIQPHVKGATYGALKCTNLKKKGGGDNTCMRKWDDIPLALKKISKSVYKTTLELAQANSDSDFFKSFLKYHKEHLTVKNPKNSDFHNQFNTINHNSTVAFNTATTKLHRDNVPVHAFVAITVVKGKFSGGELMIPELRFNNLPIAVEIKKGDVLLMQSRQHMHGNRPITCEEKNPADCILRESVVFGLNYMSDCACFEDQITSAIPKIRISYFTTKQLKAAKQRDTIPDVITIIFKNDEFNCYEGLPKIQIDKTVKMFKTNYKEKVVANFKRNYLQYVIEKQLKKKTFSKFSIEDLLTFFNLPMEFNYAVIRSVSKAEYLQNIKISEEKDSTNQYFIIQKTDTGLIFFDMQQAFQNSTKMQFKIFESNDAFSAIKYFSNHYDAWCTENNVSNNNAFQNYSIVKFFNEISGNMNVESKENTKEGIPLFITISKDDESQIYILAEHFDWRAFAVQVVYGKFQKDKYLKFILLEDIEKIINNILEDSKNSAKNITEKKLLNSDIGKHVLREMNI